jgi:hypothetical protein
MGSLFSLNKDEALIEELERSIFDCEVEIDYYNKKRMYDEVKFYKTVLEQRRASLLQLKTTILLKSEDSLTKKVDNRTKGTNSVVEKFDEEAHNKLIIDLKMSEHKMLSRDKYNVKGIGEQESETIPLLPIAPSHNFGSQIKPRLKTENGLY